MPHVRTARVARLDLDHMTIFGRVTSVGAVENFGHYRVWNFFVDSVSKPMTSGVPVEVGDVFIEGVQGSYLVQISDPDVQIGRKSIHWKKVA